ncbi:MAG: YdcF family protein [Sulfurimonas sp.]|nr:YdcF family protein [Sulfurimonas sp.]
MEFGFYLKKMIAYCFEPFGMVFILFFLGICFLFINKGGRSKLFLSLSFSLLFLYSYPPFSNYLVSNLENKYLKYEYKQDVKYIHVLGNRHNVDLDQPLSSQISDAGIKRDLEGVLIHLNTKNSKLIFTGYAGKTDISNAKMNAKLAIALGVDEKNIIVNPNPRDTKEEALFTKTIVGDELFVLVTSATHMPRSMMLFKSLGLNPIPAPTNFYKEEFKGYLELPDIKSFNKSQVAVHEYLGILWVRLKGMI